MKIIKIYLKNFIFYKFYNIFFDIILLNIYYIVRIQKIYNLNYNIDKILNLNYNIDKVLLTYEK